MSFPDFSGNQGVEAVIISLIFFNFNHSRFLEEIASNFSASNIFGFIEVNLHVFTEPTGVVVSGRFAVTKGFKNRIATEDFLLN
jgi:hypothetical protein